MADQDAIALLRELLPVAEETCKRWPNDDCYLIPTAKARNFLRASEEQKAAGQAGQNAATTPSQEGHAAGLAPAAPVSEQPTPSIDSEFGDERGFIADGGERYVHWTEFSLLRDRARQLERELAAAQSATPDSDTAKDAELYRWLVRDTGALYSFVSVWLGTDSTEGNVDRAVKAAFSAWQRRNAALASSSAKEQP